MSFWKTITYSGLLLLKSEREHPYEDQFPITSCSVPYFARGSCVLSFPHAPGHALGLLPAQGGCISNGAQEEGGISVVTGSSASSGHSRRNGTLLLPRWRAERHYVRSGKQQTYQESSQSATLCSWLEKLLHKRWMEIHDAHNSSYLVELAPQCMKQRHFSTSILHYGFKITDKASKNFSF